jgi:hypothetical protein
MKLTRRYMATFMLLIAGCSPGPSDLWWRDDPGAYLYISDYSGEMIVAEFGSAVACGMFAMAVNEGSLKRWGPRHIKYDCRWGPETEKSKKLSSSLPKARLVDFHSEQVIGFFYWADQCHVAAREHSRTDPIRPVVCVEKGQ